jgi:DNA-binding CsgD family transcriptional regulator
LKEFATGFNQIMKVSISARQLEILRKAVYGLSPYEIANQLMIQERDVEKALKDVFKSTHSKEPLQAMQNLAKNGFQISE